MRKLEHFLRLHVCEAMAIIDHKLYWASLPDEIRGSIILTAILNSETARAASRLFRPAANGARVDFDKVMFTLPIPRFDVTMALHNDLAAAAAEAERIAAAFELPETVKFQRARKLIRDALTESGIAPHIDGLVARLLDSLPVEGDEITC